MRKLLGTIAFWFVFLSFFATLLIGSGCATSQKRSSMYLPECTPNEVIFITNTHENAWVEIASGVEVRRIDLRMTDEACIMQSFSPPLFGYWRPGTPPEIHRFHLWGGQWHSRPSKENPMLGYYSYHHTAVFFGKTMQGIRETVAEFIKTIMIK